MCRSIAGNFIDLDFAGLEALNHADRYFAEEKK